jgi:glutamate dehydrogenase/leucine dehydrogenase
MSTVEWRSPASEMAVQQFDLAAAKLDLDVNVAARLRRPDRAMIVSVLTEWTTVASMFLPAIGQHNDVLRPFKGGIDNPAVNLGETRAGDVDDGSALVGLPLGG